MQACNGAVVMGSLQQPKQTWRHSLSPVIGARPNQLKLNELRVCECSRIEGSLVTGRPPSSVSVPIPEMNGEGSTV